MINSKILQASDYIAGEQVKYVPNHANGNVNHKDCEIGIVKRRNGILQDTAQGTDPDNLVKWP